MNLLSLLAIAFSFEVGGSNNVVSMWETKTNQINFIESDLVDSKLGIQLKFWDFYVGGTTQTPAKINNFDFRPLKATYFFDLGYKRGNFEIGYQHYCSHPHRFNDVKDANLQYVIEGGSNKAFVRFQYEFHPFR